jgi:CheY-like chemotaxis protein
VDERERPMSHSAPSIMLVEDNPMDVDLTTRAFGALNLGDQILVCRNGAEALDQISAWDSGQNTPTVILLDLKLPKVGGTEVLRQLKGHPQYKSIPVVVLTTSAETTDLKKCYDLGANSYIVKPFNFEKFQEVVKQIDLYWLRTNKPPQFETGAITE